MVTARRPRGSLRQASPRRQAGPTTWPTGPDPSKPWYIDNWSFGEAPPPEAAALEDARRKKSLVLITAIVVIVILAVTGLAVFVLL